MPRPALTVLFLPSLLSACATGPGLDSNPAPDGAREVEAPARPWLDEATARMMADARAIRPEGDTFAAEVPTLGIHARFHPRGATLGAGDTTFDLSLVAWGRDDLLPVLPVAPALGACTAEVNPAGSCVQQLSWEREGLEEWWVTRPDGLEQGFTLLERPHGDGPIRLAVAVEGADLEATADGQEVLLTDREGRSWWYAGPRAWDADGDALSIELTADAGRIFVTVDDDGATWPLTVDPVVSTAGWSLAGANSGEHFGRNLAALGDVNGDGYDDVAIAAEQYGSNTGRVYVFHGTATGLPTTASLTLTGAGTGYLFGAGAVGCDLNQDGYGDLVVGAPGYSTNTGQVYSYMGSASGLASAPSTTLTGPGTNYQFGGAIGCVSDVNKDGFNDVIIGAYQYSAYAGRAYGYYGNATGIRTTTPQVYTYSANYRGGYAVTGTGDVNNDGYGDFAVGAIGYPGTSGTAYYTGRVYLYRGSSTGFPTGSAASTSGSAAGDYFGAALAGGNWNGDAYSDLAIGAYGASSSTGRVQVHHGSASGLPTAASLTLTGPVSGGAFGTALANAGDVNGDTYGDLVVGAPSASSSTGQVFVYQGSSTGLGSSATTTLSGETAGASFGMAVLGGFDVRNDGYDDLLVGAPERSSATGKAYLYDGGVDADSDGFLAPTEDCNDASTAIHPGATETFDFVDQDCDGVVDDGLLPSWGNVQWPTTTSTTAGTATGLIYGQVWHDGYTNATGWSGMAAELGWGPLDSDPSSDDTGWTWVEGTYNSDSGNNDEFKASLTPTTAGTFAYAWRYSLNDGHDWLFCDTTGTTSSGAYEPANQGVLTVAPGDGDGDGYTGDVDCDDEDPDVHPGATEVCNEIDDDCDDLTDEGVKNTYWGDVDEDGYGDPLETLEACSTPFWYVTNDDDCNDTDPDIHPGAAEAVDDGVDQDCSGGDTCYLDADHDGWGTSTTVVSTDLDCGDTGEASTTTDCDDTSAAAHPGASETCNGVDDDCDGSTDEGVKSTWYRDADTDGWGDATVTTAACSAPTGYVASSTDCDDTSASVNPAASETCNGVDDDCDGSTDEGVKSTWYRDADADGWGNATITTAACTAPTGYVASSTDCDDSAASVHPGATETVADGVDQDCSGGDTCYRDTDGDHYGSTTTVTSADLDCGGSGESTVSTDCNDGSAAVSPGATESCNGVDDDCDGTTDEGVKSTFYGDLDEDGYGDAGETVSACTAPSGYVTDATDCDDTEPAVHPGATETCNGVDDDCDASTDEGVKSTFYGDLDEDGYGDAGEAISACTAPSGYVSNATDCDDTEPTVHPGATETCNGVDDDCDGTTDEGVKSTFWGDLDEDGYGDAGETVSACTAPSGYVSNATDCDDLEPTVHPGATETVADGVDQDCSGGDTCYRDADRDTWGIPTPQVSADLDCTDAGESTSSTDCDDAAASTYPGASETFDFEDDDCDDAVDEGLVPGWGNVQWPTSTSATAGAASDPIYGQVWQDGYTSATGWSGMTAQLGYGPLGTNPSTSTAWTWVTGTYNKDDGNNDEFEATLTVSSTGTWAYAWRYSLNGGLDWLYADTSGCTATDPYNPAYQGILTVLPVDEDDDGYRSDVDCDDTDGDIHPGATEVVADGIDQDCSGGDTCYLDADGDGYGTTTPRVSTDLDCTDTAESTLATDCDDSASTVRPGATETCNGADDDCDGSTDEGVKTTFYADDDGDGYGDPTTTAAACSAPTGYVTNATDCDDDASAVYPSATEVVADGTDQDCNGGDLCYRDADRDGYGTVTTTASTDLDCADPTESTVASDCDDTDASTWPGASETCDGEDDDCDGTTDEGVKSTWYRDLDRDGFGDATRTAEACTAPSSYVSDATDCDDTDDGTWPGATEVTGDGVDQSCDGRETCYRDADDDGWRLTSTVSSTDADCDDAGEATAGDDAGDCDDARPSVYPGASEACNGLDDDCDGTVDDGVKTTFYADADDDGYGDAATSTAACTAPSGWVTDATDCDDTRSAVSPGAEETCDGLDDDCDGTTDEADATDATSWYLDADSDGYGDAARPTVACTAPSAHVADATDCDDLRPGVNPAADEACNGLDDDCDGTTDEADATDAATWYRDADADGYGLDASTRLACTAPSGFAAVGGDCDDTDAAFNPGASEDDCTDPTDWNCDGSTGYADDDGDGFPACAECDDADAGVNPDAVERCNGLDDDCDGLTDDPSAVDAATWIPDADADGYGDSATVEAACAAPSGFIDPAVSLGEDCDDDDPSIHPDLVEVCNGIDDNCDGSVDDAGSGDAGTWYADADGDGWADGSSSAVTCTAPTGYIAATSAWDCDDTDADVHPAAAETCDGVDDDCDGTIDEPGATGERTWYTDQDGDLYGLADTAVLSCTAIADAVAESDLLGWDCDDEDGDVNPGATETCDGADDDCDGTIDEAGATGEITWYADADDDGWVDPAVSGASCAVPAGALSDDLALGWDCDDTAASVNPDATEACNGVDDDCDGDTDEAGAEGDTTWYPDADADGYADPAAGTVACTGPEGWIPGAEVTGWDCDDANASINPAATEVCNGSDDDCDGTADESNAADASTLYRDADGDGWGDAWTTILSCDTPTGYVANGDDCDDLRAAVFPGAEETCNGLDDDCDLVADEPGATGEATWYLDTDGDGFGQDGSAVAACDAPTGHVPYGGDCNDADTAWHPGAAESDCSDPNDYNCDGSVGFSDSDGDGFPACLECDDTRADINPEGLESCDLLDNDCDGTIDESDAVDAGTWLADLDIDGYGDPATGTVSCDGPAGMIQATASLGDDCDDANAAVHPGATETCDGSDEDCDGTSDEGAFDAATWYADADADAYPIASSSVTACTAPAGYIAESGTWDCDDARADVNPSATETCNGLDDDCDGATDEDGAGSEAAWYADLDGDGYGDPDSEVVACAGPAGWITGAISFGWDCDDEDETVHPDAEETCNGLDDDCDEETDEAGATGETTWYRDADADGYGLETEAVSACDPVSGFVALTAEGFDCDDTRSDVHPGAEEADCTDPTDYNCDGSVGFADLDGDLFPACEDCNDSEPAVNPGGTESCNDVDDDCDGDVDEAGATGETAWYLDADGDGYGDETVEVWSCDAVPGYEPLTEGGFDCDDARDDVHPGADESDCTDPTDYNCDGSSGWADDDGDGWAACQDCDDSIAEVNPDGTEVCNGLDDDCDGTADGHDAEGATTWYPDADGDGYTAVDGGVVECQPPAGYAAASGEEDCDDGDATANPGAEEVEEDGTDNDCDGTVDETDEPGETGETGAPEETGSGDTAVDTGTGDGKTGCGGCATGGRPLGLLWFLALAGLGLSRRRGA